MPSVRNVVKLIVAGALIYAFVNTAMAAFASGSLDVHGTKTYIVHAGDTLYEIAGECRPNDDPFKVVDWIRAENHIPYSTIQPGAVLTIPRDK